MEATDDACNVQKKQHREVDLSREANPHQEEAEEEIAEQEAALGRRQEEADLYLSPIHHF